MKRILITFLVAGMAALVALAFWIMDARAPDSERGSQHSVIPDSLPSADQLEDESGIKPDSVPLRRSSPAAGGEETESLSTLTTLVREEPTELLPVYENVEDGLQGLVVAMVNGTTIKLEDLTPHFRETEDVHNQMSPVMYKDRLRRAIERELVFQTAESMNVQLSEKQVLELTHRRRNRMNDEGVVDSIGDPEAKLQYELKQDLAYMLEKMILQQQGVALPYVSKEQVEEYYSEHRDEFAAIDEEDTEKLDAAWHEIDLKIRRKFSTDLRTEYQRERDLFFSALKDQADIVVQIND